MSELSKDEVLARVQEWLSRPESVESLRLAWEQADALGKELTERARMQVCPCCHRPITGRPLLIPTQGALSLKEFLEGDIRD